MLRKRRRDRRKSIGAMGELMLLTDTEECEPTRERERERDLLLVGNTPKVMLLRKLHYKDIEVLL